MNTLEMNATNTTFEGPPKVNFTWYDYSLFSFMLILSALIGVYFGFIKKQANANEYLLGGRTMRPLPIAMSLVASSISGVALLAIPSDIYQYGANYWLSCLSVLLTTLLNGFIYLPVLHRLKLTSAYEYLKMRFNNRIRMFASFLFGLNVLLHLPLVIYVPALALEQVTDINIHLITPIICAICIFYTTIGGLKAVVWTDMLQFSVTIGAMIAVFYLGIASAGGLDVVFSKAHQGGRLEIDFDISPTVRDSFWVIVCGWTINSLSHLAVSQSCVQKFMAVPTLKDANIAMGFYVLGCVLVKTTCVVTGFIMYAKYMDCDPIKAKLISKPDQILPFYVMDVSHKIPGLPGLFIAGVFCASLSTLSAAMNCLAGTIYEDFISRRLKKSVTTETVNNILKIIVVLVGVVSVALVYVVEHLGNLLPIVISFTGVASGPLLGLFTLGVLFPRANAKGALAGAITALAVISTLFLTVQYYKANKMFTYATKPLSTEGCTFLQSNSTLPINDNAKYDIHPIFRVSYYYYTLIGTIIVLVVGNIVSLFTQNGAPPAHPDLLSPVIRPFLSKNNKLDYYTVDKALSMVTYEHSVNNQISDQKQQKS